MRDRLDLDELLRILVDPVGQGLLRVRQDEEDLDVGLLAELVRGIVIDKLAVLIVADVAPGAGPRIAAREDEDDAYRTSPNENMSVPR